MGCRSGKLRLGKTRLFMENALKLGIWDYVDEPEFSDEGAKLRGMEFAAVYTTGILGKTPSWVLVIIDRFAVSRADGTPS